MTRAEAIEFGNMWLEMNEDCKDSSTYAFFQMAIASLTIDEKYDLEFARSEEEIKPVEKIGHCKDCKWWKDKDGVYRRGFGAKSKCPINHKEVYEGNGYCLMFEPQESDE